jgi:hypothetical protein
MKSTIFKYPIEITDDQILQLPLDAQILCVKDQNGRIVYDDGRYIDQYAVEKELEKVID